MLLDKLIKRTQDILSHKLINKLQHGFLVLDDLMKWIDRRSPVDVV